MPLMCLSQTALADLMTQSNEKVGKEPRPVAPALRAARAPDRRVGRPLKLAFGSDIAAGLPRPGGPPLGGAKGDQTPAPGCPCVECETLLSLPRPARAPTCDACIFSVLDVQFRLGAAGKCYLAFRVFSDFGKHENQQVADNLQDICQTDILSTCFITVDFTLGACLA